MLSKPRIAINDMRFPQDRGEILRRASDCSHCECFLLFIVRIVEVILALSEIDDFCLVVTQKKEIGWFDVSVADSLALQERTGRDETAVHPHKLRLGPEEIGLLAFTV